jgi:transcription elongation factor GreA
MAGEVFLSRKGYETLRQDLDKLRARREQLAVEIAEAREKGDLKENAEYHAAKEEQQKVVRRMDEIKQKLQSSRIIEEMGIADGEIRIGCSVTLKDLKYNEEVTYVLVDGAEADFSKGRISVRSPLAEGLLGHKEGEQVTVNLPAGPTPFKILKVAREL